MQTFHLCIYNWKWFKNKFSSKNNALIVLVFVLNKKKNFHSLFNVLFLVFFRAISDCQKKKTVLSDRSWWNKLLYRYGLSSSGLLIFFKYRLHWTQRRNRHLVQHMHNNSQIKNLSFHLYKLLPFILIESIKYEIFQIFCNAFMIRKTFDDVSADSRKMNRRTTIPYIHLSIDRNR